MPEIQGEAKTIRRLLSGEKYTIDYYQREYKWETKQVRELIDDLANKFLEDHDPAHERGEVENYGHYFLGSIIVSRKDNQRFLIDGQQRLTSLTLLLIFLNNLQRGRPDTVNIDELIFSEIYAERSFNIQIDERIPCMEALFENKPFDENDQPESVQNIIARYQDIEEQFPEDLMGASLPFFIDWLQENVHLVEITAFSDEDAYTIFETMNDRGLSLSPIDMLKGYLLANILDGKQKTSASRLWKEHVTGLREMGKDVDADFFKAWLRSQYAESIRERKRNAQPEDFDRIGTEFHRWVRDHERVIGLQGSDSFVRFVDHDFNFFSRCYLQLMEASPTSIPAPGLTIS